MFKRAFVVMAVALAPLALADDTSAGEADGASARSVSVNMTVGITSTFQMPLGGAFGLGPDLLDTMSVSLNNAFRSGDSLSVFGWNSTDLRSITPDWQGGLGYDARLFRRGRQSLTIGVGVQRWVLPNVATGAKDWLSVGHLTYGTSVKGVPLYVTENSWSLMKSTLPTGSAIYTQVYTQHSLVKKENFELVFRQGPSHSYSWNFYGLNGNCVLHYGGSLAAIWRGNVVSGGYHRQFGLQDGIPNSNYWEFSLTRQLAKLPL